VLYIRDTEDDAIYEKADWEDVIGAERNRYFVWHPAEEGGQWPDGLRETGFAPRQYRPPSGQVDVKTFSVGDPYPGQTHGMELRVDQESNLRAPDGALVAVPRTVVEAILNLNVYRRAVVTPAGHVIVRGGAGGKGKADWRFVGEIEGEPEASSGTAIRLKLMAVRGRSEIAREQERRTGVVPFALGPGRSRSPAAGQARDRLIEWVNSQQRRLGLPVRSLYWDGGTNYWLEIQGERIPFEGPLAPLEFE